MFSEINSTFSPASLEDLKYDGMEDVIYQKDAVMDVLELTMPNVTDSNEILQLSSNMTTVLPNRANYTTQGIYNLNLKFLQSVIKNFDMFGNA